MTAKDIKQTRKVDTKIIATLGPASANYDTILALYVAGADCFRLNFSHGTHDDHRKSVEILRKVECDVGADIGIIADLQGPKLRIGKFAAETIALQTGMKIKFDLDPAPGDETRVSFPHPEIIAALEPGAKFLMDDGNVGMRIAEKGADFVVAEVEYGTSLSSKKGVNVPELSLPVKTLTAKDRADLDYALQLGVDYIAQSFVQSAADVDEARAIINGRAGLIAKIEKPAAIADYVNIVEAADAIMVARGDLGVEIALEDVPGIQKMLINQGQTAGKPVIVATQMLDSMRESPRPTRAEVSDVNLAVIEGASAVMLSGETSVGKYPVQSVDYMDRICYAAEKGPHNSRAVLAKINGPLLITPFKPHLRGDVATSARNLRNNFPCNP